MNPALILTHNSLALTQQCVESLRKQDIPVDLLIVDNHSTDGTLDWCAQERLQVILFPENTGFSHGINAGLDLIFSTGNADYCLCPGSDTIMPSYYYRALLELNLPVVSGVQDVDGHRVTLEDLAKSFPTQPVRPNPDFSNLLWRKEAWQALGGLDEAMVNYCSDCDAHIRAHRKGLGMYHAPHIPFFHYGSSTLRNAPPKERRILDMQADADRLAFAEKWGHRENGPEYEAHFAVENFGIERKN